MKFGVGTVNLETVSVSFVYLYWCSGFISRNDV